MLSFVRRCITSLKGQDDRDIRLQQISFNGKSEDAEIYAPYGMSYNVPDNSLCVYLQIGGDPGNLVVLPDRSQDRVKNLKSGEVAFFNPLTQSRTVYRENGDIEITTDGDNGSIIIVVKKDYSITVTGNVNINVTGNTSVTTGGKMSLDAGGDIDITAVGDVNITGDTINLN